MFVDEIVIYARAGHGGKGCVAFQREKYRPKGGPSGGNGGRGGDVILEADHDLNNLNAQFFQPRLIAQDGQMGMGKGMDGHAGKDVIVKVPRGTMVWNLPDLQSATKTETEDDEDESPSLQLAGAKRPVMRTSGSAKAMEIDLHAKDAPQEARFEPNGGLVADLTEHGQRFTLCKGGRGGLGNRNFATATRQTPRFAQPGEAGGEGNYKFELRILAEVGLVGYPNAGKSTLLGSISRARPKVAAYPFTTLHPQVGIVEYPDMFRLTVCDVPGLIEGAHMNVGLGHRFLRHIQRCKLLVILLDMAGMDGRAPWDDYKSLLSELETYDARLLLKPRLIVANKMDETEGKINLAKFKRKVRKIPAMPISAAFGEGLDRFLLEVRQAVTQQQG